MTVVWRVLRVALLVLWLLAAAGSWWTAPRQVGYDEARAAIADKSLTVYQWGDTWDSNSRFVWFAAATLLSSGQPGPTFAWRTADGRVRWADTESFDQVTTTVAVDGYSGPGAAGLAQQLQAAGLENRSGSVEAPGPWATGAAAVLALAVLVVIIAGPAPVLGTRWFWFWLTSLAPLGLGVIFWLLRDRPWSRSARPAEQPGRPWSRVTRAGASRDRGWFGLVLGLLAAFLLGVVLTVLNSLLGDRWVPQALTW
ncbi:hypothetical protein [Actinoplanes sp. HUAS TT8]|uniref:hypothetical protein n=1 Tax=Actinoplanes sp. HUAS TT8 TaxID=3447453 RepID=UPI003F51AE7D